jgi:hypothetical protein
MTAIIVDRTGGKQCEPMGEEWPGAYIVDLPDSREWIVIEAYYLVDRRYVNVFKEENRV